MASTSVEVKNENKLSINAFGSEGFEQTVFANCIVLTFIFLPFLVYPVSIIKSVNLLRLGSVSALIQSSLKSGA